MRRFSWLTALAIVFAILAGRPTAAHDPFELTTQARLQDQSIDVRVTVARSTALQLAGQATVAGELFDVGQFPAMKPKLLETARRLYEVRAGDTPLLPRGVNVELTPEEDVEFTLAYPRPPGATTLRFDATHIQALPDEGYGDVLTVIGDNGKLLGMKLLVPEDAKLEVPVPASPPPMPPPATATPEPPAQTVKASPIPPPIVQSSFGEFLRLGVEHILSGYDHLLFLAGLLVVCHRFATVAAIITCFTLAHSITLALAAFNLVIITPAVVEPLIAATIIFVGVQNLIQKGEPPGRWKLAFAFGLIHGFGFAGVLRSLGLGQNGASLAGPLLAFNLGVEIGQLAVAAVILPIFWIVGKSPVAGRGMRIAVSGCVAVLGVWWFLQRTIF